MTEASKSAVNVLPAQPSRDQRGDSPAGPGRVSPSRKPAKKPGRDDPPAIVPKATDAKKDLIPIVGTPSASARPRPRAVSTSAYWMGYYKTHDESPRDLKEKLTLLNMNKKAEDVEAVLKAYLTFHPKAAESWMYEALAIAIKMNGGSEHDCKTALGYAADLAEKSRNPNNLVSTADMMFRWGEYSRVGKLLDMAAEKVPHRSEPTIMMINLAQKTGDPQRMARAVDTLLSLGWPGFDEQFRRDAHAQVETLAKTLREEKRDKEADELLARLADSEARDVFIRLTWLGDAGLSLSVEEPLGATARDVSPRTVFGGSIVKGGYGNHPESIYVCPRAFDGDYTVRIETIYNNPKKPALEATLETITHEGASDEHKQTHTIRLGKTVEPVVVHLKGGRRKSAMPFLSPQAAAQTDAPPAAKDAKTKSGKKKPADTKASPADVKTPPR